MPRVRFGRTIEEIAEPEVAEPVMAEVVVAEPVYAPAVYTKITEVRGCLQETYDLAAVIMNFLEGSSKSFAWFNGEWRGKTGRYRIQIDFQPDEVQ